MSYFLNHLRTFGNNYHIVDTEMYDGITFHDIEDETYLKIKVPMVCRGIKDTVEKILEFRIYPTQEPEIRYSPYDAVLMNPDLVDLFLWDPNLRFRFHYYPKLHRSQGIPIDLPIHAAENRSHLPVIVRGVHEWVEYLLYPWPNWKKLDSLEKSWKNQ